MKLLFGAITVFSVTCFFCKLDTISPTQIAVAAEGFFYLCFVPTHFCIVFTSRIMAFMGYPNICVSQDSFHKDPLRAAPHLSRPLCGWPHFPSTLC